VVPPTRRPPAGPSAPASWRRRRVVLALAAAGAALAAACGGAGEAITTTTTATTTTATSTSVRVPVARPLAVEGPGRYDGEVFSGGLLRRFVLVVPEAAPRPAPLVIVFHGFMGSPQDVEELSRMTALAEEKAFLVAYPEGSGLPRSWRSDPRRGDLDVVFTRDLVALLGRGVGVDPRRVYAAGMSNGGGMAARLACDASDLVAAVGTVAAAYPTGGCPPGRPVPVAAFHGTDDPIVPYEGWPLLLPAVEEWLGGWAGRNGCRAAPVAERVAVDVTRAAWGDCPASADVVLYTVEGGRHGWPGSGRDSGWGASTDSVNASELLWEFFAAHPLP
jgi:polyhydroxybutyrate depolymerase